MHIMMVVDGRSPTARSWIQGLLALQHRVTVVSTFPCAPLPGVEAQHVLPVAFSGFSGGAGGSGTAASGGLRGGVVRRFRSVFLAARYLLGPLSLGGYGRALRRLVEADRPDVVHALRIPFEGMLAAAIPAGVPLVVSIWGNDLTLHASGSKEMGVLTRRTLQRANGLMADAHRDIRLGQQWGFAVDRPTLVVPGGGGIDLTAMHRARVERIDSQSECWPCMPLVINPRGFRPGSVHTDIFFQAIPLVLERRPKVFFVCPAMAGQAEALRWVNRFKIGSQVRLLPHLPQAELWDLFMRADVSVSLSSHDGTPNSLLEAMACGCFPIAGDIESLREWITPGVNGLLVEPTKAQALAEALLLALEQTELRSAAAEYNLKQIHARAEVNLVRAQMQVFYQRMIQG